MRHWRNYQAPTVKLMQSEGRNIDLVIIGGGCAGLSLAEKLCHYEENASGIPSIMILEPRTHYSNDRSWCFWDRAHEGAELVDHSWPRWEFSHNNDRSIHSVNREWEYQFISSSRFYNRCLKAIERSLRVTLQLGVTVSAVQRSTSGYVVNSSQGQYHCKKIVDTRPPSQEQLGCSLLKQVFYGVVLQSHDQISIDLNCAKVMSDMQTDKFGFKFTYLLPLSQHEMLIEVTRFTPFDLNQNQLKEETMDVVNMHTENAVPCIVREEFGVIPMGMPTVSSGLGANYIRAGLAAGAARSATGYAFKRIQNWSDACAKSLVEENKLYPFDTDSKVIQWMDETFLATLRKQPELAPKLFMALAKSVKPIRLVRFLTDQPRFRDLVAIILALPTLPLLRSALKKYKQRFVTQVTPS